MNRDPSKRFTAWDSPERAHRVLFAAWTKSLELFFPSTCRLCDRNLEIGGDFCDRCRARLRATEELMKSSCLRCGRPGSARQEAVESISECQLCRGETLAFDECIALWTYDELVRTAVIAAKYGSRVALADALGRSLGERCVERLERDPPDVITPVPTPFFRRVQRGRGGSPILAEAVMRVLRRTQAQTRLKSLMKTTRGVKKQALLAENERRANIQGAFAVPKEEPVREKHILVVDDVMTSGATANEISTTLKRCGARRVTVAVVARACGA
ncbi:MAG: double zinc ribbon domain-containing protein [Planctomycetota bacterium]